ncbi:MAG: Fur family transcriptional regulator, peroxide stress response regulator [Patescibacteria group bacterium]|jgi:Fur family peroxide stress response transcriptional regulator|nr:Fur family transcriptional regulator, peroxide stress response regulator [Patescibacteria group bacterium]
MQTITRTTKYSQAVQDFVRAKGHATNADILQALRQAYPDLSATTVHRITARLVEHGELALAPNAPDGSARFDANLDPHDHFACSHCSGLRDVKLDHRLLNALEQDLGGCKITGQLLVQGSCVNCQNRRET